MRPLAVVPACEAGQGDALEAAEGLGSVLEGQPLDGGVEDHLASGRIVRGVELQGRFQASVLEGRLEARVPEVGGERRQGQALRAEREVPLGGLSISGERTLEGQLSCISNSCAQLDGRRSRALRRC